MSRISVDKREDIETSLKRGGSLMIGKGPARADNILTIMTYIGVHRQNGFKVNQGYYRAPSNDTIKSALKDILSGYRSWAKGYDGQSVFDEHYISLDRHRNPELLSEDCRWCSLDDFVNSEKGYLYATFEDGRFVFKARKAAATLFEQEGSTILGAYDALARNFANELLPSR